MKRVVLLLVICLCAYSYAKVVTGRTERIERDVVPTDVTQETSKFEFYPTISYQGLLKDSEGKLVADGSYSLTFSVYDAEISKEKIWKEVQTVEIKNGIVNCYVGAVEKLNLPFDKQYWLSVSIGEEELPRMIMGGTPYSLHARRIAEDAIVAGKNISVSTAEDGKLRISGSSDLKNADGTIYNLYDGGTGGLRMLSCNTTVGDSAVALGRGTKASGNSAFSSGYRSIASGTNSTATGCYSAASGSYSTALGYYSTASGTASTALGGYCTASGSRAFAVGHSCEASGAWVPIAIGSAAKATANNTVAIGTSCEANAEASLVFGISCKTQAKDSTYTDPVHAIAMGSSMVNNYINSMMVGFSTDNPSLFVSNRKVCVGFTKALIDSIYTSNLSGESNSDKELLVNGKIVGKELELKTDVWADYVFKKDYELKPLSVVEKHIIENGHLPGIIPEVDALKNGVNVGDVQVKLLEKIEELTLYLIEQDKQIKELQEKIK
ncbi:MAG: hypothetical protein A2Y39_06950 [Candidatus Delongbacteria bacterium GWF2_40_14]|nr:MAG: hypothetical protein A2Y39_06950 [Candidatus Delongbacteria bacterium GWF2_40_14]